MNSSAKQVIAVVSAVVLIVVAVFGSFLPWRKSHAFIDGSRNSQQATTLLEFENALSPGLDAASPIGQNELVRNVAGITLSIVRNAAQNKELVQATIDYVTNYYKPILEHGSGPSFSQDLYVMGLINESAYIGTKDVKYLSAAQNFYEEGNRRGPRRPQFLYGLFDIYRFQNDKTKLENVFNAITAYWPQDENIKAQYQSFLHTTSSISSSGIIQ